MGMTREQFYERRAIMDFEKKNGVTKIEPVDVKRRELTVTTKRHRIRHTQIKDSIGRILNHAETNVLTEHVRASVTPLPCLEDVDEFPFDLEIELEDEE